MIVKVKEPQPDEIARLKSGQTLFTYLASGARPRTDAGLLDSGVIGIAYETRDGCARRLAAAWRR